MVEPSEKKNRQNKEAKDSLARQYREVGIKAVAAAVESTNNAAKQATSVKKLDSTKTNRENE
jgi:hypothetical protein